MGCAVQTILLATLAFAAAAPMSQAQLALYHGADREKILVEGAKREGQFTLYTSHTWFKTFIGEFEKNIPSFAPRNGATIRRTFSAKYWKKRKPVAFSPMSSRPRRTGWAS
jgi:hypothetical protein